MRSISRFAMTAILLLPVHRCAVAFHSFTSTLNLQENCAMELFFPLTAILPMRGDSPSLSCPLRLM